jgi:hypothetical protein
MSRKAKRWWLWAAAIGLVAISLWLITVLSVEAPACKAAFEGVKVGMTADEMTSALTAGGAPRIWGGPDQTLSVGMSPGGRFYKQAGVHFSVTMKAGRVQQVLLEDEPDNRGPLERTRDEIGYQIRNLSCRFGFSRGNTVPPPMPAPPAPAPN